MQTRSRSYLQSQVVVLNREIDELEQHATTPEDLAELDRLIELRDQMQSSGDLLGIGQPQGTHAPLARLIA
jgi:hypothetical protein